MLAVVSAVVAFDRWPGGSVQAPAQTLLLEDKAPAIRVSASASSTGPSATAARAGTPRIALAPRRTTPNVGGVGGQRFTGGTNLPAAAPANPAPGVPPSVTKQLQPVQDTATPIFDSISNPGTTAGQIADRTQAVTDAAGVSVGRVNPDIGNVVTAAGQTASQTVREVPLPNNLIPGH